MGSGAAATTPVAAGPGCAPAVRARRRVGHIIVSTEVKADDLVNLLSFGGEHEDGRGNFLRTKLFADVVTARARQHDVQHDERRLKLGDGGNRFVAAIARGGLVAFAFQHFLQPQQNVRGRPRRLKF